jgi:signal transduction histidine kinase
MGLLGMQERVSHLGGSLAVESEPGAGATLRVILPVAI